MSPISLHYCLLGWKSGQTLCAASTVHTPDCALALVEGGVEGSIPSMRQRVEVLSRSRPEKASADAGAEVLSHFGPAVAPLLQLEHVVFLPR